MASYLDTPEYRHQIAGARAKAAGAQFEALIEQSLVWHEQRKIMRVRKTPEPMKPIQSMAGGRFVACYTKAAQVDYSGTIRGGRSVRFEAKYTDTDRFERKRLTDEQMDDLEASREMGALTFVIIGFGGNLCLFDHIYRIPWPVWRDMKEHFGRLHITEDDVQDYRIPAPLGTIMFLDRMGGEDYYDAD